jgi:glutaredoxin
MTSVSAKQCGNTVPVELFITTATASLPVKKDQQSLIFLLDTKKVKYDCFDVASDEAKRLEMHQRSGQRKLPQLFVDGKYIGVRSPPPPQFLTISKRHVIRMKIFALYAQSYDEALMLEEEGQLAPLLNP